MSKKIKNFIDIKSFERNIEENIAKLHRDAEQKNKDKKPHVTIAVSPEHRCRFKEYCAARGLNMKDVAEEYIDSLVLRGFSILISLLEMTECYQEGIVLLVI
jgi:hypothetical protein